MIVTQLRGGLGNQMFQYAFAKCLAIKHNTKLLIDKSFLDNQSPQEDFVIRNFDLDIFDINFNFISIDDLKKLKKNKSFISKLLSSNVQFINESNFGYNSEYLELPNNVHLTGYWQSELYFKEISALIKTDFTLKNIFPNLKVHIDSINKFNSVCVHFRRTDYITSESGKSTHGETGLNYYYKALDLLKQTNPNIVLFVFSDDINWCIDHFKYETTINFVNYTSTFEEDFHLMIHCKHFIIPNSTFSWWASWLSNEPNKTVYTPHKWFQDTNLQKQTNNMHPKEWKRIIV